MKDQQVSTQWQAPGEPAQKKRSSHRNNFWRGDLRLPGPWQWSAAAGEQEDGLDHGSTQTSEIDANQSRESIIANKFGNEGSIGTGSANPKVTIQILILFIIVILMLFQSRLNLSGSETFLCHCKAIFTMAA